MLWLRAETEAERKRPDFLGISGFMSISSTKDRSNGPSAATVETLECRLLLLFCRPGFDKNTAEEARALITVSPNWDLLAQLARREGVLPMVAQRLTTFFKSSLPANLIAELGRLRFDNASRNLIFVKELVRIQRLLETEGIPALTFKGPVLAQIAYGSANLRRFNDVDLIVPEQDYLRCQEFLYGAGYERLTDYGFEVSIRRKDCWAMVDLHRRISSIAFPFPNRFDSWWRDREVMEVSGHKVATLSLIDHLLVVIVQISRDRYENKLTLSKLCDVALLLQNHPALDLDAFLAQAKRLGVYRRVITVLGAVHSLLDLPPPPAIADRLPAGTRLSKLARFTRDGVLDRSGARNAGLLRRIYYHYQVHEGLGQKLSQLWMVPLKARDLMEARSP